MSCDPVNIEENLTVSGFLRQNPWGKMDNHHENIISSQIVHCPWGHTKDDIDNYNSNPNAFNKKFAKQFVNFPLNSFIIIGQAKEKKALVVQLISAPLTGILDHLIILRKKRTCNHDLTINGEECNECQESIVKVYNKNSVTKEQLLEHMKNGHIYEDFHSIYRKVKIIGFVHFNNEECEAVKNYVNTCQNSIKSTIISIPKNKILKE
jgi:hypothetical protein